MALRDYRVALVTGASSGIGAAIVETLAARGLTVHALARRRDRLEELARRTGCRVCVADVRDTEALAKAVEGIEADILVNNAGIGAGHESLLQSSPAEIAQTIETNLTSTLQLSRLLIKGMVARKRGHVLNIGSWAGLYAQGSALYGASKGAIHLMTLNLRLELLGTGVRLTEVLPGRVATEFHDHAIRDPAKRAAFVAAFRLLTATDVADAALYALDTPPHVNVNMIELAGLEQATGGVIVKRVE